jgi:hypothetical protein
MGDSSFGELPPVDGFLKSEPKLRSRVENASQPMRQFGIYRPTLMKHLTNYTTGYA